MELLLSWLYVLWSSQECQVRQTCPPCSWSVSEAPGSHMLIRRKLSGPVAAEGKAHRKRRNLTDGVCRVQAFCQVFADWDVIVAAKPAGLSRIGPSRGSHSAEFGGAALRYRWLDPIAAALELCRWLDSTDPTDPNGAVLGYQTHCPGDWMVQVEVVPDIVDAVRSHGQRDDTGHPMF